LKEHWPKTAFTAWDCCAASGGKSILLHDHFPKAKLSVSDVRESILHNLRSRFRRAGISSYQAFVADLSSGQFQLHKEVDVVICDAPCSGSGTWGRTPEQLVFFQRGKIDYYANLQKSLAVNASRGLKQDGAFLYITCSVFHKENEDVVAHIQQHTTMKLLTQQYFKGYTEKADTLFAALFTL
jgi:16S rRNA (cytosine967-C5)-methyltransferase